jgi:putative oxidoreductase
MKAKLHEITVNLLRISSGLLYVPHGCQKLFGEQPPDFTTLLGLAGLLELIGGSMIILGLFTRPVAFVLSGQMAVAYWMAHAPRAAWPIDNGGELAVLFCFIYLFLFANGGGSFSIDGFRKRGKRR